MRSSSLVKILVIGLAISLGSGALVTAQTNDPKAPEEKKASQPKHKKPAASSKGATQTQTQTQTAPATKAQPTQPRLKNPALNPHAVTQGAPAAGAKSVDQKPTEGGPGKAPGKKDPAQAGMQTIFGRILAVHPEQHSITIQTDVRQVQVYATAQTQITRDGQAVKLKDIQVNDRAESCRFNAKHVAQNIKVTSAEKALLTRPTPPPKQ
jgi:hypothetical protein